MERTTGVEKSTGLRVRIARLESVVERLSQLPPDQATDVVSNTSSQIQLQLQMPASNTREMAEALERQQQTKPPLFALFSNEVV